jgi:hypothetical protein
MERDYEALDALKQQLLKARNYRNQSFPCCSSCVHLGGDGEVAEYCDLLIQEGIPRDALACRFTGALAICDAYDPCSEEEVDSSTD